MAPLAFSNVPSRMATSAIIGALVKTAPSRASATRIAHAAFGLGKHVRNVRVGTLEPFAQVSAQVELACRASTTVSAHKVWEVTAPARATPTTKTASGPPRRARTVFMGTGVLAVWPRAMPTQPAVFVAITGFATEVFEGRVVACVIRTASMGIGKARFVRPAPLVTLVQNAVVSVQDVSHPLLCALTTARAPLEPPVADCAVVFRATSVLIAPSCALLTSVLCAAGAGTAPPLQEWQCAAAQEATLALVVMNVNVAILAQPAPCVFAQRTGHAPTVSAATGRARAQSAMLGLNASLSAKEVTSLPVAHTEPAASVTARAHATMIPSAASTRTRIVVYATRTTQVDTATSRAP
jgi:hypothetical protein